MASTAVAVLALLAASAVLAAPAAQDTEDVAAAGQPDKPSQAMLYEAADSDTASNKKDRKKKQTTTICVQVSPGRPGHSPAVLCGDKDDVDEQKRRFELQRLMQAPVVQLQPQAGYFGSPHVVQIVPAGAGLSDSVAVEAPGLSRADTVVVGPSAPATQGTFTFSSSPFYRAADAGQQQQGSVRASEQPQQAQPQQAQPQQAQPQQPASMHAESKPAVPEGHSLSGAFAASAPPMTAATAATNTDHANKAQARSFGDEEIIVSQQSGQGFGYGSRGPQQVTTVVRQDPFMPGASQVGVINSGHPGGFPSPMGFHPQPPMIGGMGMNYRAAEVAAAQPGALQQQQQQLQQQQANAQAADAASQPRTATLLQQPVVVQRDMVIPAVGTATLSVNGPSGEVRMPTLPELLNPVSPMSGLGHLSPLATPQPLPQRVEVRQNTGQASIPITLNCDLSTLQYRGSPQQQLQLNLARPGVFVTNGRAAENEPNDPLKQTLGAAMDAAVRNSTVTVHLNGSAVQANDLHKLQEELLSLQQREKMLYETIQSLKAAGSSHPDHAAAIVGLERAADQITKARAAVEQAIMQPSAPAATPAAPGAPRAADAFGDAQSMSPAGLQDRMRSSAQFRYFPDPGLAIGPSSSVVVGMSPSVHSAGIYPTRQQQTTIVSSSTSGGNFGTPMGVGIGSGFGGGFGGGFGNRQHFGDYRAAAPQPAQPQPAQQQPQPAQPTQTAQTQVQPAQQREEPLIQPAVPGSPATQQKLLQQLRQAQEDVMRMRSASLPRDEPRQANSYPNFGPTVSPIAAGEDEFPPTPGYKYVPKAAEAAPSQASFTMTTGPLTLTTNGSANGPALLPAPGSPKQPSARQVYWGR